MVNAVWVRVPSLAPKNPSALTGIRIFYAQDGTRKSGPTEGRVRKCPVDTFLARGRVPQISDASSMDVDEI